jgi:hypothetical protein
VAIEIPKTLIGHPPRWLYAEKFTGGPEGQWERDATLVVEAHAAVKKAMDLANRAISRT